MNEQYQEAADILLRVEAELRRLGLWQSKPPSAEALASELPFCCDTLDFHQWLQFVLIERMKALIEAGHPLPSQSGIAPLAEEWFAGTDTDSRQLVRLLEELDNLLSNQQTHGQ